MKVTTLACIQGAWLPAFSPATVLDIGAGTGLLSLMAAQKYRGDFDAVEIEAAAYSQLRNNINQCPWQNRINYYNDNIKNFANCNSNKYDFIITNPPFFNNQLKSPNIKINIARHESGITLEDLVTLFDRFLNKTGKISVILPPDETAKLVEICGQNSLFISDQLVISDIPGIPPIAIISVLDRRASLATIKNLDIKKENGAYSQDFVKLLKDYYLYL